MSQMDVQLALILNDTLALGTLLNELVNKIEYARSIPTPASRRSQASANPAPSLPSASQTRLQTEDYEDNNFTPCNSQCCVDKEEGQYGGLPTDWERL